MSMGCANTSDDTSNPSIGRSHGPFADSGSATSALAPEFGSSDDTSGQRSEHSCRIPLPDRNRVTHNATTRLRSLPGPVQKDAQRFAEVARPAGHVEFVGLDPAHEPVVLASVGFLALECPPGVRRVAKTDVDTPARVIKRLGVGRVRSAPPISRLTGNNLLRSYN